MGSINNAFRIICSDWITFVVARIDCRNSSFLYIDIINLINNKIYNLSSKFEFFQSRSSNEMVATNYSIDWRDVFLLYRWRCRFPGSGIGMYICSPSVVIRTRMTNDSGRSTIHTRRIGCSKSSTRSFGTLVAMSARSPRHRTWVTLCTWTWSVSFLNQMNNVPKDFFFIILLNVVTSYIVYMYIYSFGVTHNRIKIRYHRYIYFSFNSNLMTGSMTAIFTWYYLLHVHNFYFREISLLT